MPSNFTRKRKKTILGGFNAEISEPNLASFSTKSLINKRACYENPDNPSCIDLKLVFAIFYQIFIFSLNDNPSKTMKSVFYFI